MAIKKSELYSSLWKSCDELRGGMDASQYKDYILVLLFMKYVSDKYAGQPLALLNVPSESSFHDMVKLVDKPNIGEQINIIIENFAKANSVIGLGSVIALADFNDEAKLGKGQEKVTRLSNLIRIFNQPALDFRKNRADGDDLLGDAYEYLMRHFATESGKSKGQFYTPAEVSRVIAKVIGVNRATRSDVTVYDPTCGSGSLLLKAADEARTGAAGARITIYGQEKDNATAALAKMNMYLHDTPTATIEQDNSLTNPLFKDRDGNLKTFDYVVANPPFSDKAWSNGLKLDNDPYQRFADGKPPQKNGDYAFLLHILRSMKGTGSGAVVMPLGVLFRGNTEGEIRKKLVQRGVIKGIIGLPPNLFYGTGIPACIIVLNKREAATRTGIFMVDASAGFMKDGNKNRLREQDIHQIVDVFMRGMNVPHYARMVENIEIAANGYNLNIPRYIDSGAGEDVQDIAAHLWGGIPLHDIDALDAYWTIFPSLKTDLIGSGERAGACTLRVPSEMVTATILAHREFIAYRDEMMARFAGWCGGVRDELWNLDGGCHPKELIARLGDAILAAYHDAPLLDRYDLYQHVMMYWAATMQDDVYQIVGDGWTVLNEGSKPLTDLLPPSLVVARYFAEEQRSLDALEGERDAAKAALEEMDEEHGGEDGILVEARNEKGAITAASLRMRLMELAEDEDAAEEHAVLGRYSALLEQRSDLSSRANKARKQLDEQVAKQYVALTVDEIKTLVIDDKWLARVTDDVRAEMDRVSHGLAQRLTLLAERYAVTLPALDAEVATRRSKVAQQLERMGYTWR